MRKEVLLGFAAAGAILASCGNRNARDASRLPSTEQTVRLALGSEHSCALLADGTAPCWGSNLYGQLGQDEGSRRSRPPAPMRLKDSALADHLRGLAAGGTQTCAWFEDGHVACAGADIGGGLALASPPPEPCNELGYFGPCARALWPLDAKPGPGRVDALAIGASDDDLRIHICAAAAGGGPLRCSQAAHAPREDTASPWHERGIAQPSFVVGAEVGCALSASGDVSCWGHHVDRDWSHVITEGPPLGELPTQIPTLSGAVHIATSRDHTCAAMRDGSVRCFGFSGRLQLGIEPSAASETRFGDRYTAYRREPVTVAGLDDIIEVATPAWVTCALRRDGAVLCLGNNTASQFGNDDAPLQSKRPYPVRGLPPRVRHRGRGRPSVRKRRRGRLGLLLGTEQLGPGQGRLIHALRAQGPRGR